MVLAVMSSVLLGGADFAGGVAAKRLPAVTVVFWSNLAGLAVAIATIATVAPGQPRAADVGWGLLAGLASCVGTALLYRALAGGLMMLAAPVAAVAAALLPLVVGLLLGNHLRPLAVLAVVLALLALALVTRSGRTTARAQLARHAAPVTVVLALGAGLGFGAFMVSLSQTPHSSGL